MGSTFEDLTAKNSTTLILKLFGKRGVLKKPMKMRIETTSEIESLEYRCLIADLTFIPIVRLFSKFDCSRLFNVSHILGALEIYTI